MKIFKHAAKYWYFYLIAFVAMIGSILLDMASPMVTKKIVDDVITDGNTKILMSLLIAILAIGFGRAVTQYVKEFLFDKVSITVGSELRRELFEHIQGLSVSFFDKNNTGELMARVKDDIDKIWNAIGFVGMLAIEGIIYTVSVLVCMITLSPVLTIIPVIVLPIVGYTAIMLEKKIDVVYGDISEENARLNTVAQENLAGVRTVKAFARERYEIKKFKEHNERYCELNLKQSKTLIRYYPNISFYTRFLLIAVVLVGGLLTIDGKMTLGDLSAFTQYANNIIWPMEILGWLCNDIASGVASSRKIKKIFDEEAEIKDSDKAVDMSDCKGEINFENVTFELNDATILSDISFKVEPGKTIGIMGMTGAGKTSIVNLLERFYDVKSGSIKIDGKDVRDIKLNDLRKNISVVMQDVFLFSDTIMENISIGSKGIITQDAVCESARAAKANDFIDKLKEQYDTVIGERGVGLSGGQKQRISIARAIAKNAPILILDDSTSALDMETEYEIQREIEALKGVTKMIIAHRISAVKNADEIIILDEGRIAERGSHDELMKKKGLYYDTYVAQYANYAE